jgi:hypothetical protein
MVGHAAGTRSRSTDPFTFIGHNETHNKWLVGAACVAGLMAGCELAKTRWL